MSNINFTYTNLTPFKWYVLENFPFIEVDFDALTNWQLFCKLGKEMNKIINSVNLSGQQVETLTTAFNNLQNYVNNYFENLDVQDEINNKLNQMVEDGTLLNIFKPYLDSQLNMQNQKIDELDNKVNSAVSGAPSGVFDTLSDLQDENPDHSKIYLVLQDGKWYYYNTTSSNWVAGGTYQATGIGDNEVDYLNLDSEIAGLIIKNMNTLNLGSLVQGFQVNVNESNKVEIKSSQYIGYYKIDVSNYIGKLMFYTANAYNNQYGVILADINENVLFHSASGKSDFSSVSNGIIKIPLNAKYLYVQANIYGILNPTTSYIINRLILGICGILGDFTNNFNYDDFSDLQNINEVTDRYMNKNNVVSSFNMPLLINYNTGNFSCKLYKIFKGAKYKITGSNYQESVSFVITDNNWQILEKSSDLYDQNTNFDYDFTCKQDGYIVTTDQPKHQTLVYIYNKLKAPQNNLDFSNLKIGFTGDSICAGDGYKGGYSKILSDNYGLNIQNIGVSGGRICENNSHFVISNSIQNLEKDCDAYIIEGGINDYTDQSEIGEITDNFTDSINQNTFIGALEKIARDLYTNHPGKKFAYLIINNTPLAYVRESGISWSQYRNAIYQVCEKYGIAVIDIGKNMPMNCYNDYIKNNYTANSDGLHPNKIGYETFYIPLLVSYIKTFLQDS